MAKFVPGLRRVSWGAAVASFVASFSGDPAPFIDNRLSICYTEATYLALAAGPEPLRTMLGIGSVITKHAMIDTKKKQALIKKFQTHAGDTGSSEVQIAILTAEIEELIGHLKMHPKDHSSRRGLLRKVSSRRSLMRFLKKENQASYDALVKKLKIKQARALAKPGAAAEADEADSIADEAGLTEKENEIVNE